MSNLSHLRPDVRPIAELSVEERISYMKKDFWVGYPRANEILKTLSGWIDSPRSERPPCMLVVAHTNNGKTSLLNEFTKRFPADPNADGDHINIPIVQIRECTRPDEAGFYEAILNAVFVPYRPSANYRTKQQQVFSVLNQIRPSVLAIDEINALLAGSVTAQKQVLNAIRIVSNKLRLPIVGFGTEDAFRVLATDPQLSNRFENVPLPRWQYDTNFRRIVASFEGLMPLREPSDLQQTQIASMLHTLSEGLIGELRTLLRKSAGWALERSQEHIDLDAITKCGFVPPKKRRTQIPSL